MAVNEGQFFWFTGEVVDVDDPQKLGRVRVKTHGDTDGDTSIQKDDLHWALVSSGTFAASLKGASVSHGLVVGTQVIGFYMDGPLKQAPFVMFTFNAKSENVNDLSPVTQAPRTAKSKLTGEPVSGGNPKYPHNKVLQTPTGHLIEVDDTKGSERLSITHTSGSTYEFMPDGTVMRKSNKGLYDLVANDKTVFVGGSVNEVIKGNYTLTVDGNFNIKCANYNIQAQSANYKIGGAVQIRSGSYRLQSGGQCKINASMISLN